MIRIDRYDSSKKNEWNEFNKSSKNYLFMFERNFMEYHSDRFLDHSLMFYYDDKLVALLPLSEHGEILKSHGGLTYGGFIVDSNMKQHIMNDCFDSLIRYSKEKGFKSIIYKCIPHIYYNQPAEEDKFALFSNNARIDTVDVSTYLNLHNPLKMTKGRKAQISRAKREGVLIAELNSLVDFEKFIALENDVLTEHHGVKAVHTGQELKLLYDRFPHNIHLFVAEYKSEIIAGTVVFEYESVIHTQYMAANDIARSIGALDLVISTVIEKYRSTKNWLDFGISTEHGKIYLNEGLCSQKESFGGRTGTYEIWSVEILKNKSEQE